MRACGTLLLAGLIGCDGRGETAPTEKPPVEAAEPPAPAAVEPPEAAPHFITEDVVETTVDGDGEGPYRFTAIWHKNAMETWERLLEPLAGRSELAYLEIGAFEGRSLLWMIEKVLTHPTSRATVIDVFMGDYEQTFDANVEASKAADRITKIKGTSALSLRGLPVESFDIVYIDGSHTADDVLADAVLSWDLLKVGGLMIFDDYGWRGRPQKGSLPSELRPKIAVDAFVAVHRSDLEMVHRGYQVFVRKVENPCNPKDYCSALGRYTYYWRELELRQGDGTPVPLTAEERGLVETLLHSRRLGDNAFALPPELAASDAVRKLTTRLGLEL